MIGCSVDDIIHTHEYAAVVCVCVWVYVCMQEGDREREYEREGSTLLKSANDYEAGFAISKHHHRNLGDVFKSSHVVTVLSSKLLCRIFNREYSSTGKDSIKGGRKHFSKGSNWSITLHFLNCT